MSPKMLSTRGLIISRVVPLITVALLIVGCSPKGSDASKTSNTAEADETATATTESARPVPDKDHQACFACEGKGTLGCKAGCANGKIECTGPCLRLTRGKWEHMDVAGHPPTDLWQKFPNGQGGYMA